jgi:hypothetical protein
MVAGLVVWEGGWCGDEADGGAVESVVPWKAVGKTTQFVPGDHMNVATRA